MTQKRRIEILSAGCPICESTVQQIQANTCPCCDVQVLSMAAPDVAARANRLKIRSIPAVLIDGNLADCCLENGPDLQTLKHAGLGIPTQK